MIIPLYMYLVKFWLIHMNLGIDTALFGHIWKYHVSLSSVTWYRMSNYFYIYSMLYIQNDELFISGNRVDSNNNVQVGRIR